MTREQIRDAYESAGWRLAQHDALELVGAEARRYTISTHELPWQAAGPLFEIRDEESGKRLGERKAPHPARAAELLGRYGVPTETLGEISAEPPMVPLEEEL